jgi:hypothetical protein
MTCVKATLFFYSFRVLAMYKDPEELREFVAENTMITLEIKADYLAFFDAVKAFRNYVKAQT